jgi:hypothetical protein
MLRQGRIAGFQAQNAAFSGMTMVPGVASITEGRMQKAIPPAFTTGEGMQLSYTGQLVFRDSSGRVSHAENYSSQELEPDFEAEQKLK